MNLKFITFISTMLLLCQQGFAGNLSHGLGGFTDYLIINDAKAEKEGVGDDAFGLGIAYTLILKEHYFLTIGLGGIFFDDKDEFKQVVKEERIFRSDRFSTESSDVIGGSASVELGLRAALNQSKKIFAAGSVGYRYIGAEREISNCIDCDDETVDIDGGLFLKPSLNYMFSDIVQGSVGYQFFPNSDVEGAIMIAVDVFLK